MPEWFVLLLPLCRCFFLDKLQEKLLSDQANDSMEVDEECGIGEPMEVDQQSEDIPSMIRSCKFNMKMKMIESARKQVTVLSDSFWFLWENVQKLQLEKPYRSSWVPFSEGRTCLLFILLSWTLWMLKKFSSTEKELFKNLVIICHYWRCA